MASEQDFKSESERIQEFLDSDHRHPATLCPGTFKAVPEAKAPVVVVRDDPYNKEVEIFHSLSCPHTPSKGVRMDRDEALENNLRECQICNAEVFES